MSEHHHYDHRDAACEDCMARETHIAKLEAIAKAAQGVLAVWDGLWEIDDWFGGDDDPPVMHVLRDAVVAAGYELLPRPTLPDEETA